VDALVGLRILEDPKSVAALRPWINDHDQDNVYNLATALAEIASEEAIAVLQEMSATQRAEPLIRGCIQGSLEEAIAKKKWREYGGV
jgi:HEAT repeat protein